MLFSLKALEAISIRKRIVFGFGSLIILIGGTSLLYDRQLRFLSDEMHRMMAAADASQVLGDLDASLRDARRAISRYIGSPVAAEQVASVNALETLRTKAEAAARSSNGEMADLSARIEPLRQSFAALTGNIKARQGANSSINASAARIVSTASALVEGTDSDPAIAIQVPVRLLRDVQSYLTYATRFSATHSDADADLAEAELNRLLREQSALRDMRVGTAWSASAVAYLDEPVRKLQDGHSALIAAAKSVKETSEAIDRSTDELSQAMAVLGRDYLVRREQSIAAAEATARSVLLTGALVSGAAILFGILIAYLISGGITKLISRLTKSMGQLSTGDLNAHVPDTQRADEIGSMARAVEVFKQNGLKARALEAEAEESRLLQAKSQERQSAIDNARAEDLKAFVHLIELGFDDLSTGNLTTRMDKAVAPEFEPIRAKFNGSVSQLEDTIGAVVGSVGTMRVGLNEITVAAGDLSQRTEQQAASLEETVAALAEVVRGVNGTAQSADDARAAVTLAQKEAEKGGVVVTRAVAAMAMIEQSSAKIGSIIGVIDEIAFQTNLLALNAGVEAARAGEAGRGFAVVAQEVRGLAQRSAEAAKEIKDLIQASSLQVGEGVDLVSATGHSLEQIVDQVSGVAKVITEMASAAREQSVSLREVATAADQMDKVTQQNAAMVEETTAAAQSLLTETDQLAELVADFRTSGASREVAAPRVAPLPQSSRPVRQMRTGGHGGLARKEAPKEDTWSDF